MMHIEKSRRQCPCPNKLGSGSTLARQIINFNSK
uniref:Uncharacterized protein n=1 Tax=Arundo donax TaxID=35708 RepID=A0A0A9ARI8_ARUDO